MRLHSADTVQASWENICWGWRSEAEGWELRWRDVTGWFEQRAPAPLSMTYILPYCYSSLLVGGRKKKTASMTRKDPADPSLGNEQNQRWLSEAGWTQPVPHWDPLVCFLWLELLLSLQSENAPVSLIAPGESHLSLWPKWNTALPTSAPLGASAKLSGVTKSLHAASSVFQCQQL